MYEFVDIKQIIDFLIHDDTIEDDSDINLFCPESTDEERYIIEYYVAKYCAQRSDSDFHLVVKSALEDAGIFYVDVYGFDYKVEFEYIIH